jgi:hypothetical protein
MKPQAFVISANITRRHLTPEQKRDLLAELIKADPTQSNRQIAERAKVDHKTVGVVRTELETTGEIPQLTATTGKDGKTRKVKAKGDKKSKPRPRPEKDEEPKHDKKKYNAFLDAVLDALAKWPRDVVQASEWHDYTLEKLEEVMSQNWPEEEEGEAEDELDEAA